MTRAVWLDSECPIARSMAVLGERWSVLILREALRGRTRFSEFRSELGVASDILSARLSALVGAGILEAVDYQEPGDRRRQCYELTAVGREASTILVALAQWGHTHLPQANDNGLRFIDEVTSRPVGVRLYRRDGEIVDPADVVLVRKPG